MMSKIMEYKFNTKRRRQAIYTTIKIKHAHQATLNGIKTIDIELFPYQLKSATTHSPSPCGPQPCEPLEPSHCQHTASTARVECAENRDDQLPIGLQRQRKSVGILRHHIGFLPVLLIIGGLHHPTGYGPEPDGTAMLSQLAYIATSWFNDH